ncbi:MAG: class I SAM-dependent methyltransferase [Acidobacteriota bacterium]|nr:class I SAM-dependent methyltransferase [Acidobacteriota bacterium]
MRVRNFQQQWARLRGALQKLRARVPLGGERVWPAAANDLFVAHESIYRFFAGFADRRRILDAGCGLGYGSDRLAAAGAREVLGIDLEAASLRYASRNYRRPNLRFEIQDLEKLDLPQASFDLVVSSNAMEHLRSPERFLRAASRALAPGGEMLLAVPPITNEHLLADNQANPHHLSNLTVDEWLQLFQRLGLAAHLYRHGHPQIEELDFSSHLPSRFAADEFTFVEVSPRRFAEKASLTAVFRLQV